MFSQHPSSTNARSHTDGLIGICFGVGLLALISGPAIAAEPASDNTFSALAHFTLADEPEAPPPTASAPPAETKPISLIELSQTHHDPQTLSEKLEQRERLGDVGAIPKRVVFDSVNAKSSLLALNGDGEMLKTGSSRERPMMGTFNMPLGLGNVSLVSQEIDENGNVKGVQFFSIDRPESAWDVDLDVDDGAVLELTRKWGKYAKNKPFKNRDAVMIEIPAE